MLGKLIKHEFIDNWKLLVLLDVLTIIVGAILGLYINALLNADDYSNSTPLIMTMGFTLYVLILPSLGTITLIYIGVRYYKSLYSSQGYLTFTLPATTNEILFSKMLVAYIFELINILCIILSFGLVMWGIVSWSIDNSYYMSTVFTNLWEDMSEYFYDVPVAISGIFCALTRLIYFLMTFFFAISLGQLWQKHRIIGAIVSYFGIKIVISIVYTFIKIALANNDISDTVDISYYSDVNVGSLFVMAAIIKAVEYLLVSAVMYFGCVYITKHKLNLE